MRPFLSGVLFLAAGVGAQQASYTYTPQPPPYVDPSPLWLTALNTPRLGTTFQLKVPATYGSVYAPNHVLVTGARALRIDTGSWIVWFAPTCASGVRRILTRTISRH